MAPGPDADRVGARTVLLADDDEDFRVALAEALEEEGYNVIPVRSGSAVLAVLDAAATDQVHPPDLLVLDLLMPHLSGIEVLQRLRKSKEWASLPVLVVTGVNDPMLPVRLDAPIAFKPDAQTVLAAVRQQLGPRRVNVPARAPSQSP
jgi:CheY-like chemotaxis protein